MEVVDMISNNLFDYATSELSHDAFICYLLSFAAIENKGKDECLTKCAQDLIVMMGVDEEPANITVTKITRQHLNIDVLVEINHQYNILLENKVYTNIHGDQINRYRKKLADKGIENIRCVYYKIIDQPFPEDEERVKNISRYTLLDLLENVKTSDKIFNDYLNMLKRIEMETNSYTNTSILDWSTNAYRGFFRHIATDVISPEVRECGNERYNWEYISNPTGGFMCFYWYWLSYDVENMKKRGLQTEYITDVYLQIENDIIAVKIHDENKKDREETQAIRYKLFEYFKERIPGFQKRTFRYGRTMTVGYIQYDERNYREKIKAMENTLKYLKI